MTPPLLPKEPKGLKLDNAETTITRVQAKVVAPQPPKELDTPKVDVAKTH